MRYLSLIGFSICVALVTIAQPAWAQVVQVTGIEVKRRTDGVEVRLETSGTALPFVFPSPSSNSFVVDIPNTQLKLPDRETFRLDNPVTGITSMTIKPLNKDTLRIEVHGAGHMPNVMLTQSKCVENTSCKRSFVLFLAGSTTDGDREE